MNMFSSYKSLILLSALTVGLAGCNTIAGVGRDIAGIGNFIAGGATDTQDAVFGSSDNNAANLAENSATRSQPSEGTSHTEQYSAPNAESMQPASGGGTVYFDTGSATLSTSARDQLRDALGDRSFRNGARIEVIGYADSMGSSEANERLSQRRAEAVALELSRLGIPDNAVDVSWRGESEPAVATGDGISEAENRRVTISYSATVAQSY